MSASVAIAAAGGVKVFATGGIGGVHRGSEITGDISADLDAIASHPVVTVSAGAKAFLDLPRTLEFLEAAGVPVLGWQHDWFPAFYTRSSGLPIPHRVETADEVARIYAARSRPSSGMLLTVPVPEGDELDPGGLDAVYATHSTNANGPASPARRSPRSCWAGSSTATEGRSVPTNLALAENNATIAAAVALAM